MLELNTLKLQILKAIHNAGTEEDFGEAVGTQHTKITNLESNSQHRHSQRERQPRWNSTH